MDTQTRNAAEHGLGGRWNWLLGGALGGVVGSALFGVVLWMVDPHIVTEAIPAIYGFEPGTVGWVFHLVHGLVLGVLFGLLVSRQIVLGTLAADVETEFLAAMSLGTRFVLAGIVYGLAIWAILPIVGLTVVGTITGAEVEFPAIGTGTLLGHMLYGAILGALFSAFVNVAPRAAEAEAPFEETDTTEQRP